MFLIFDTETTGLPKYKSSTPKDSDHWPYIVQLAWQVHKTDGSFDHTGNLLVKPNNFTIPPEATMIHGITQEKAMADGIPIDEVLDIFLEELSKATVWIGHNIEFDMNMLEAELHRTNKTLEKKEKIIIDTKDLSTVFCAIPHGKSGNFKWPTLSELYHKLFGTGFLEAHNAAFDVEATTRCFLELLRLKVIPHTLVGLSDDDFETFLKENPNTIQLVGIDAEKFSGFDVDNEKDVDVSDNSPLDHLFEEIPFTHLHVHTQYSILDGAASIPRIIKKAKDDGMKAVAITDHGNMFGVKEFHVTALKNEIKPILGCEMYMADQSRFDKNIKEEKSIYHLVVLAKNEIGYHNLLMLTSKAYLEGFYYKPRIDKEILEQYHEGLIVCSACLGGELPQNILRGNDQKIEETIHWFKNLFGDDYYIELQRHKSDNPNVDNDIYKNQVYVNKKLIHLSNQFNINVIATNDSHFINREDAEAHDHLLCISTGRKITDTNRMRFSGEEYFKTQAEMKALFSDIPEAITNTQEIVDKVEIYKLDKNPILPMFEIPKEFGTIEEHREKFPENELIEAFGEKAYQRINDYENALRIHFESEYMKKIVYEGAEKHYADFKPEIKERIDFELYTIMTMGFPSYFLIVWDFLKAAREMGVIVGPGRGSAAGSVVAYCLNITMIDPLKYGLLFERFLNPDRISMPDIDIDFDDDGRAKILRWVVDKYGEKRVAHIITFGRMAAKSAIKDAARVQDLPLDESNRLAKYVPERPGTTLKDAFKDVPELQKELTEGKSEIKNVLNTAIKLEGTVRNTGVHACGIIIGRDDLEKFIPITTAKDSELTYVTQFDGKYIENIGLLKMDFLGLKTLSIIKDALENIKIAHNVTIDIDNIPIDDKATYELYSRGDTSGLFQFESDGMKKYLRDLKPTVFEDLIAMNALYRPGPMQYIPQFINRKSGFEKITYDLPDMEDVLKETYGITVYQEQVMLLSRKLAGFTRGQSDELRKAMGKKIRSKLDDLKPKFLEGGKANGYDVKILNKIWGDWEDFAKYAFNKSHATCYSWISYQTAYLKAHYPADYMASVLSHNLNDIKQITFFIDECSRMGIKVKGPSVNESRKNFVVNKDGDILFGLNAIKGVGEAVADAILKERDENGNFKDIIDFILRVTTSNINKKGMESLALSGAFDCFKEMHRAQFFYPDRENEPNFIEKLLRYANKINEQKNSAQISLFGDVQEEETPTIVFPECDPWDAITSLGKEKEVTGFYISGHPLNQYSDEIRFFTNQTIGNFKNDMERFQNIPPFTFGAMVTEVFHGVGKNGKEYGRLTLEDVDDTIQVSLFGDNYLLCKPFMYPGKMLYVTAKIETKFFNKTELDLKIISLSLLENLITNKAKRIILSLDLDDIHENSIKIIEDICNKNIGNGTLIVEFNDVDIKKKLVMQSSKKVNIESTARLLRENKKWNYKIE